MSMVRCDSCEQLIDSDIDCGCFFDPPIFGEQSVLCKWCREADEIETETPVKEVGQAIRAVFAAMDDLIVLANKEETRSLVCDERRAIGQLMTRCEVLCSFALAAKPGPTLVRQRAS